MHFLKAILVLGATTAGLVSAIPNKDFSKAGRVVAAADGGIPVHPRVVSFSWPPSRESDEDATVGPCGYNNSIPKDRTNFPLKGGKISLSALDYGAKNVMVKVAYQSNPTKPYDFHPLTEGTVINNLSSGQRCFTFPDPPANIGTNTKATIQVSYTPLLTNGVATPDAATEYVCSDILYVDSIKSLTCGADESVIIAAATAPAHTSSLKARYAAGSKKNRKKLSKTGRIILIVFFSIVIAVAIVAIFIILKNKRKGGAQQSINMEQYPPQPQGQNTQYSQQGPPQPFYPPQQQDSSQQGTFYGPPQQDPSSHYNPQSGPFQPASYYPQQPSK